MIVQWSSDARKEFNRILRFLLNNYGVASAQKFLYDVSKCEKLLSINPYLAPKEPLLSDEPIEYRRYVLNRINRIIYSVRNDVVFIDDIWDSRRDSDYLKTRI